MSAGFSPNLFSAVHAIPNLLVQYAPKTIAGQGHDLKAYAYPYVFQRCNQLVPAMGELCPHPSVFHSASDHGANGPETRSNAKCEARLRAYEKQLSLLGNEQDEVGESTQDAERELVTQNQWVGCYLRCRGRGLGRISLKPRGQLSHHISSSGSRHPFRGRIAVRFATHAGGH